MEENIENKEVPSEVTSEEKIEESSKEIKVKGGWFYRLLKRTFDIFSSGIMLLILFLPLGIICLIKWFEDISHPFYKMNVEEVSPETEGKDIYVSKIDEKKYKVWVEVDKSKKGKKEIHGPIYTSNRIGPKGVFKFHKIRSMCPGAEEMKPRLIELGLNESDPPAFKMKNDPRITKFGKFLRKTGIDEFGQLWDIFIGKMSVVGPRPPIPEEVDQYNEYQKNRIKVKGGLLCLWQIQHNRNSLTFDEWVDLDVEYIQKRSIGLDLKIIFKGAWMILFDHSGE